MRSKRGPENFFTYLFISRSVSVQRGSLGKYPLGLGFDAVIKIILTGYTAEKSALEMAIFPSSRGCLRTSSSFSGYSPSSSRNKIPTIRIERRNRWISAKVIYKPYEYWVRNFKYSIKNSFIFKINVV